MRSPFSPKDHLLDLDGIEIAVRCWGPEEDTGTALHGWLDNAASFERLAPMLDGCFVVAPDLVGHGRSTIVVMTVAITCGSTPRTCWLWSTAWAWRSFMCWPMAWAPA
jgi:pimeloyl-ACP methyl ester carboxylesterase